MRTEQIGLAAPRGRVMGHNHGWVTPCIRSPRGHPTNHHWRRDPIHGEILGERVRPDDATCFVVVIPGFEIEIVEMEQGR